MECPSKYTKEKQRERKVIYNSHFLFFNDHPKEYMVESAFKTTTFCYKFQWNLNSYSQTLTLLFITYTIYPSNVPILCWHQLRSLWATLQYQCDHFLQPQWVECPSKYRKEKQWERKVIYNSHFLFFNDHPKDIWLNLLLRRLHSATNFNEI